MTVREAAIRLECSLATVYALCAAKQLRHSRVGLGRGTIRISEEAVQEYRQRQEVGAAPRPAASKRPAFKHVVLPS